MRRLVDTGTFGEYLHFGMPLTLVTVAGKDGAINVSTNTSIAPLPGEQQRLALGVLKDNYTNQLLAETGEFVVNLITEEMRAIARQCGYQSGADVDKFTLCELTPMPATHVRAPLIEQCPLSIECRVVEVLHFEELDLWVADILAVIVDDAWSNGRGGVDLAAFKPLLYAFGHTFKRGEQVGPGGI